MILLLLFTTTAPPCTVITCEDSTCVIDTPEGKVETWRRYGWRDGDKVEFPENLGIDPT